MKEFDTHEFDQVCRTERQRIRTLELNDQYSQTIEYNGRLYRYDPDYDCFYPSYTWEEQSHWDRYSWLYVSAVLTVIAFIISQ